MLYGIFFEEINRAGDGGIYAEMIQNRSFEDDRGGNEARPAREARLDARQDVGRSGRDGHRRRAADLRPESELAAAGDAKVGRRPRGRGQRGFQRHRRAKGRRNTCSRSTPAAAGFQGPLAVTIEDEDGKVYASAKIEGLAAEWKKFDATLTAGDTTAAGRLVIAVASPGTLWIDQVSLFPKETWNGRPNGLRRDLAEMLAAMKPAFVRFPGGCYVEGDRLPNAFRWKNSIGDLAERPGHWNLWGYRSTDGLGYHEYLQMCEDLGAEPLFVINCGMSHEQQGDQANGALDVPELAEYSRTPWTRSSMPTARPTASGARCGPRPGIRPPSISSTWRSATRTAARPTTNTTSCSTRPSRPSIPKCTWWPTA